MQNSVKVTSTTSEGDKLPFTNAIPASVGFPTGGGGFVRKMTSTDLAQQQKNLAAMKGQRF